MHHGISIQYEPTGCTIYFKFISIMNLYMFWTGLLLIIRRYYSVYTAIGMSCIYVDWLLARSEWNSILILPAASQHKHTMYTNCCIYRVVPPDYEQQTCSKHVEVHYWNKFKVNSASCWFILYSYIQIYHCSSCKSKIHKRFRPYLSTILCHSVCFLHTFTKFCAFSRIISLV